jgi:hypothetical protein
MKNCKTMFSLLAVAVLFGASAFAQNGNPCPGDKEYQFNIIATKDKNPAMTNNDGHRIFVSLSPNGGVKTQIYMTGDTDPNTAGLQCGNKFDVLDANGTNADGATLLVPCDPLTATNLDPNVCFDVYATPLGKPSPGGPQIDVVCTFDATCLGCDIDGGSCDTGTIDVSLAGHNGKPVTTPITSVFRASGCIDLDPLLNPGCTTGDIQFNNEWIFNIAQLESYYWDYDPNGNRITQIRFCDVEGVEGACSGGTIVQ